MDATPNLFTASQIASALGMPRQTAQSRLQGIAPDRETQIHGQHVKLWSLSRLPQSLQEPLKELTAKGHYRNPEDPLTDPPKRWEPSVPLAECDERATEKASKLKAAMARAIELRNNPGISMSELQVMGLADYQRTFGRSITARRWSDLFHRTIERASVSEDFSRLELYLDERPARRSEPVRPELLEDKFFNVRRAINQCRNPAKLTGEDRRHILNTALESYDALVETGQAPKKVKTELFELLTNSGASLAANRNALRVLFDRKHKQWLKAERKAVALEDGRIRVNRERGLSLNPEDRDIVVAHAVMACGGRVSQAWRECIQGNMLSESLQGRFLSNPASKSHVPNSVRESVRYEVQMLESNHHGPRGTRDNGAYVDRYWGAVPSLAWYCADDATLNNLFYIPDGKGWFSLLRGQFLILIDTRSTCILGYALMPERNYNARVIRTLITHVCDEYGLPQKGFYFEKGIWKNSKILTGQKEETALGWPEVESGLKIFGMEFKHAIRARSKPVERVIGALQNLTEGDPGYVGRNEMKEGFEGIKKMQLAVERKALDPRGKFYSHEQWENRMAEVCRQYNADPQQGKMTMGLSPEDALVKFADSSRPPIRLGADCRYLLAHHKRPLRVGTNGITLRFGNQAFNYKDKRTGELRGQMVLAWFNPEAPGVLAVTDMNRENPFCVARSTSAPAMDDSSELLAQANGQVEEHMSHARTRYRIIKAKHELQFGRLWVNREAVELGKQIEIGTAAVAGRQQEKQQLQARGRKAFSALNIPMPNGGNCRPEQIEAAEGLRRLLAQEDGQ